MSVGEHVLDGGHDLGRVVGQADKVDELIFLALKGLG